ncbi:MAG TPA: tripartite tricarboxylate transporter substrate binding protein [Burkholderiales bacterium]|nr:tripartite tricarboxylate transporter substrate binding protein [Burkholderiales bacterium]
MRITLAAIATAVFALAAPAVAQDAYPAKPVRFIVPFPATGPLDVMARLYAQKLGERWGKNAIAENRPGATGTIGADAVAKAAPDGYTLLFTVDLPIVMAPALMKPPYDPKADLVPIAAVGETMNMLVVHPSAGVSTLAELVAAAKAKPGALTFSSAGNASPGHLCVEMLKSAAGVDLTHVPYKGAAPAMQAALAGEVSMFCGPITQGLPHVKSGKLRALGVTGAKASPLLPELKPLAAAYPGLVVSNWYAVFAPPKTPPAVLAFLRAELKRTYDDPEVRKRLESAGMDPLWLEPAQVTAAIDRDLAKWSGVVKAANIKAE